MRPFSMKNQSLRKLFGILGLTFSLSGLAQGVPDETLENNTSTTTPSAEEEKAPQEIQDDESNRDEKTDSAQSKKADDDEKGQRKPPLLSPSSLENDEALESDEEIEEEHVDHKGEGVAHEGDFDDVIEENRKVPSRNDESLKDESLEDESPKDESRETRPAKNDAGKRDAAKNDAEQENVDAALQKLEEKKSQGIETCRKFLQQERFIRARNCYKRLQKKPLSDDEFDTVTALLRYSRRLKPKRNNWEFFGERLLLHGGAEFVASSTVLSAGIHLGIFGALVVLVPGYISPIVGPLIPLSVLVGGIGGFGISSASLFIPGLSAEDIALLRAASVLGGLAAVGSLMAMSDLTRFSILRIHPSLQMFLSSTIALLPLAVALPLVWAFDLPSGAGASALSGVWMGAALASLAVLSTGNPRFLSQAGLPVTIGGVLGGAFMFGVGSLLDLERPHTWVMDVSAAIGASLVFALTLVTNAPNPAVGYGMTAGGLVLGASTGLLLSKAFSSAISQRALPSFNILPLLLPDDTRLKGGASLGIVGLQVTGRL